MIVKEFLLANTQIAIDDSYYPKTEKEKQSVYEEFNKIGCEIIYKGCESNEEIKRNTISSINNSTI